MTTRPEMPRIRSVKPRQNYKLEIQWEHNETSIVDIRGLIEQGGVFEALKDADLFATVRLGDRGRFVEWHDPTDRDHVLADLDADTLISDYIPCDDRDDGVQSRCFGLGAGRRANADRFRLRECRPAGR